MNGPEVLGVLGAITILLTLFEMLRRHRLREKCPDLQIVSTARGRFSLQKNATIEMIER